MTQDLLFSLSTLAALVPLTLLGLVRDGARDGLYWALMAVAVAGPVAVAVAAGGGFAALGGDGSSDDDDGGGSD